MAIYYAQERVNEGMLCDLVNSMHEILLDSVRGADKTPGMIRNNQNWIYMIIF